MGEHISYNVIFMMRYLFSFLGALRRQIDAIGLAGNRSCSRHPSFGKVTFCKGKNVEVLGPQVQESIHQ